jgi:hypothetical protein
MVRLVNQIALDFAQATRSHFHSVASATATTAALPPGSEWDQDDSSDQSEDEDGEP